MMRTAVVGAGLIGGSIALRLRATGHDVVVVDPDAPTRDRAASAGFEVAEAMGPMHADRELVVLAGPLDALATSLDAVAEHCPHAVVIDVGSVKDAVHTAVAAAALGGRYVGCHPMGGSEQSGFEHADADLLVGVTWAVTYPDDLDVPEWQEPVATVVELLVADFDASVLVIDAGEHDTSVALISHLPHVVANALLGVVEASDAAVARHLLAGSFRDGTRVAGRNAVRTRNMLADNHVALTDVLDHLIGELQAYRADLDAADPGLLLDRLDVVARAADAVRHPDVAWAACPDLGRQLVASGPGRAPFLVRASEGALQWARP